MRSPQTNGAGKSSKALLSPGVRLLWRAVGAARLARHGLPREYLESVLQGELDLPGVVRRAADLSDVIGKRRLVSYWVSDEVSESRGGIVKIHVVERIEELSPELNRMALVDLGGLVQRDVKVPESRPDHRVPAHSAKAIRRRRGSERCRVIALCKSVDVEPLVRCPWARVRVLSRYQARVLKIPPCAHVGHIGVDT